MSKVSYRWLLYFSVVNTRSHRCTTTRPYVDFSSGYVFPSYNDAYLQPRVRSVGSISSHPCEDNGQGLLQWRNGEGRHRVANQHSSRAPFFSPQDLQLMCLFLSVRLPCAILFPNNASHTFCGYFSSPMLCSVFRRRPRSQQEH